MNREFFVNLLFLLAINLLIKPFYIFGIDRVVQNTVPAGDYGIYFALFNFTFLFQIINDFGIQNFNNRNIAQYSHLLGKYFPNLLILKSLLALIYLSVVFLLAFFSNYEPHYYHLILFIAFNQILISLIFYLRSNISGLAMYRVDSIISVLDKLLLIVLCGALLWTEPFKSRFRIEWFIYAQTLAFSLTAAVAFLVVKKRIGKLRFHFNLPFLRVIIKKSYPYALVVFLMTIYTRIDGVMIERMLPDGTLETDIYASAYRLLDASNMFGFLFAGLLLPMFSRLIKEKVPVNQLVRFSFQFIWAGAISLAIATWFFQEEIMVLLYHDGDAYSGQILGFLIISFVAVTGSYIYGTLLSANGSLKVLNTISLVGVVINIGLNLLLIPEYKALGAAVATCFTQFLTFAAQLLAAKKVLSLSFAPVLILRIGAYVLLLLFFAFAGYHFVAGISWLVKFASCILAGLGFALLLKLLNLKYLWGLLVEKE